MWTTRDVTRRYGRLLAGRLAAMRRGTQRPIKNRQIDQEILATRSIADALNKPVPAAVVGIGGSHRVSSEAGGSLVHDDALQGAKPGPCSKGVEVAHVQPPFEIENKERVRVAIDAALLYHAAQPTQHFPILQHGLLSPPREVVGSAQIYCIGFSVVHACHREIRRSSCPCCKKGGAMF